jgi:hypothetical protein
MRARPSRPAAMLLSVAVLGTTLAGCASAADSASAPGLSMPAPDGFVPGDPVEVSPETARVVGAVYLGMTLEEATAQAAIDGRPLRVAGEQNTEDMVPGRLTVELDGSGVVTMVTLETGDTPMVVTEKVNDSADGTDGTNAAD